ncbi:MAG: hypothetical protein ILO34_04505, partial [Kiritimatiellae bacterium]|nr:hypothetical protein [Kiritimatiellia bacterium]
SYSDCGSLVFRAADGTELAHDVDTWNTDGVSAVWVNVPETSSATEIVMEWYSAAGVSAVNPASTWAGYRSVWHLSEAGTNAVHADASGNSLALAGQNGTVAAVGVVGNGRTISDISDWGSISAGGQNNGRGLVASGYAAAGSLPAPFTISFWAKHREGADVFFDYLFSRKSGGSAAFCSQLWYYGNEYGNYQHNMQIKSSVDGGTYVVNSASPFPNGEWRYLSFAVGSDSTLDVYENGELRQHIDGFVYTDNQTALSFGNLSSLDDMSWNGEFDEIRVAATKRSAAQVEAEYLAMSDAAYVSFSAVREVDGTAETGLVIILR